MPRVSAKTAVACSIGAVVLAVYWLALAPTITWRNEGADSGDLVTAAYTLGIPHAPGYPLYTLVAALFARLPIGEPARNVGLLSALAAAGAAAMVYWTARGQTPSNRPTWMMEASTAVVSLGWAFAPLFFSQAVIPEVYAVNALLVTALLAAAMSRLSYRLELVALLLGLGLAHHFSILLMIPTVVMLLGRTALDRTHFVRALAVLLAPLSLYLYLPIRAAAHPPINWGDPQTLDRFWWLVSAAPYRAYLFDLTPADIAGRIAMTARLLFQQFQPWGVALGLWGIAQMWSDAAGRLRSKTVALALGFLLTGAYAVSYGTGDSYIYLLPAFTVFVLWIAFGMGDLTQRFSPAWARGILVAGLVLLPGYSLVTSFPAMNLSQDRAAYDYAQTVFRTVPRNAVVFADGDEHLFALQYYRYVVAPAATQVTIISPELLQFDWYAEQVSRDLHFTDLAASTHAYRILSLVERSVADGRPVYTTMLSEPFARYATRREGLVSQIVGRP